MNQLLSVIILIVSFAAICLADRPSLGLPTRNEKKSTKLPPCQSCTKLVESFKKGMIKTERGKHEGGDAAWEEQRLGKYKRSEVRLVDIQEELCSDVIVGQDQCHALAETNEHLIEEWWFKEQDDSADLFSWLCINHLQVCCPPNKFGPKCDDCSDCNGNGKCKGNGTRKGNGKCSCDQGYKGDSCNECEIEYFESFRDESKLLCSHCHHACDVGGCNTAGPKGCRVCKRGWSMQPELGGCVDIDECATAQNTCTKNQFCVNNEGSYSCLECDKSCLGCSGDGPDLCNECADGYELRDGLCKDMTNERRENYVTFTRYLTYLGLCIATCVILQSSTWAASAVGLAVALYISVSEYWLHMNQTTTSANSNGPQPLEDLFKDIIDQLELSEPVEQSDHVNDEL